MIKNILNTVDDTLHNIHANILKLQGKCASKGCKNHWEHQVEFGTGLKRCFCDEHYSFVCDLFNPYHYEVKEIDGEPAFCKIER